MSCAHPTYHIFLNHFAEEPGNRKPGHINQLHRSKAKQERSKIEAALLISSSSAQIFHNLK